MAVYQLDDNLWFPSPELGEEDGLIAIGGDLSIPRLLLAYTNGIFPWYEGKEPILWWCPMKRFIIRPDKIHVSHSMRKFFKKHEIYISINRNFAETIHRCRTKREEAEGTWLNDDMEAAYNELHRLGYAISVEAYIDGQRAGGLYGELIGNCFIGESMFSDMENGSKCALILLAHLLAENGCPMIDCQLHTDHLESMGGEYIPYEEYMDMIRAGINKQNHGEG